MALIAITRLSSSRNPSVDDRDCLWQLNKKGFASIGDKPLPAQKSAFIIERNVSKSCLMVHVVDDLLGDLHLKLSVYINSKQKNSVEPSEVLLLAHNSKAHHLHELHKSLGGPQCPAGNYSAPCPS